ncbi:formate dehydrogenase accessory sulfurtransferase FdhD [Saxibacter everestensis]|uniref:Sulfur carrier protein FdhD n=1 Tax=Saxibacter everestensis TaxID=2909229 RepID=A0ABY8QNZ1_9MICO|nr:formate dehydrogenase accessory sulfurtransferase FdhD [Brevibacteriaceae bacterium ZFBP1038]
MGRVTQRHRITRYRTAEATIRQREDVLAVEEPLELRVNGTAFTVTMRTPGEDFDLAAGFLVSEGAIWAKEQLAALRYCAGVDENGRQTFNVIDAELSPGVVLPDTTMERHVYTSSACGICGSASIDAVSKSAHFRIASPEEAPDPAGALLPELISSLPGKLRASQQVFDRTGGVHAAGLFSYSGELLCLREDVGRHNAVDKVTGWALREDRLPLDRTILQVSGRASFELVQKAQLAGIPVLAAVSAPSSLAADLARTSGITLIGFSRDTGFNIYAHPDRIDLSPGARDRTATVQSAGT